MIFPKKEKKSFEQDFGSAQNEIFLWKFGQKKAKKVEQSIFENFLKKIFLEQVLVAVLKKFLFFGRW